MAYQNSGQAERLMVPSLSEACLQRPSAGLSISMPKASMVLSDSGLGRRTSGISVS